MKLLNEGDRHVLIVDRDACRLYELAGAARKGGRWSAWSGAYASRVHLSGAALCERLHRLRTAADGPSRRLKASVDMAGLPPQARIVAQAMKTYGLVLADNGSSWYVSGAPSPRWSNDELHALGRLTGTDFEVVDTAKLRP